MQREVTDAERLMEARFWEFTAEMPDHKHSLETTLELRRNGKLVRYLASSTFGPVVRPVIGDSKTQSVLVVEPRSNWDRRADVPKRREPLCDDNIRLSAYTRPIHYPQLLRG